MSVVVRLLGAASRQGAEVVHEKGDDVGFDDGGTLVVTVGEGKGERTIAVYAPGVWASAEVR